MIHKRFGTRSCDPHHRRAVLLTYPQVPRYRGERLQAALFCGPTNGGGATGVAMTFPPSNLQSLGAYIVLPRMGRKGSGR
jgi:hypothetical protein